MGLYSSPAITYKIQHTHQGHSIAWPLHLTHTLEHSEKRQTETHGSALWILEIPGRATDWPFTPSPGRDSQRGSTTLLEDKRYQRATKQPNNNLEPQLFCIPLISEVKTDTRSESLKATGCEPRLLSRLTRVLRTQSGPRPLPSASSAHYLPPAGP